MEGERGEGGGAEQEERGCDEYAYTPRRRYEPTQQQQQEQPPQQQQLRQTQQQQQEDERPTITRPRPDGSLLRWRLLRRAGRTSSKRTAEALHGAEEAGCSPCGNNANPRVDGGDNVKADSTGTKNTNNDKDTNKNDNSNSYNKDINNNNNNNNNNSNINNNSDVVVVATAMHLVGGGDGAEVGGGGEGVVEGERIGAEGGEIGAWGGVGGETGEERAGRGGERTLTAEALPSPSGLRQWRETSAGSRASVVSAATTSGAGGGGSRESAGESLHENRRRHFSSSNSHGRSHSHSLHMGPFLYHLLHRQHGDSGGEEERGLSFDLPLVKNGLPRGRIRGRCSLEMGSSGHSLLRLGSVGGFSVGGPSGTGSTAGAGTGDGDSFPASSPLKYPGACNCM